VTPGTTLLFGDKAEFAIEILPFWSTETVTVRGAAFVYWIHERRFGSLAEIDLYDLHASFEDVCHKGLELQDCRLFGEPPAMVLQGFAELLHMPQEQLDSDRLDALLQHSLWFHHTLGGGYLLAVACNDQLKLMFADEALQDVRSAVIAAGAYSAVMGQAREALAELWEAEKVLRLARYQPGP